jgi:hypothetical protein
MNIIKLATRNELNTRHNEKKRNNVLEKIKQTNQSLLTLPSIQKFNTNSKLVESLPRFPPQVQPGVPPPELPPPQVPPQVQAVVPPQVQPKVPPPELPPPQVQPRVPPPELPPPRIPAQLQPRVPPQVQAPLIQESPRNSTYNLSDLEILDIPSGNPLNYNACLVHDRIFFRSVKVIGEDDIMTCKIKDFKYVPGSIKTLSLRSSFKNNKHVEDPRVILHRGNYFICYTDGYNIGIAKLDLECNTIYSHYLKKPDEVNFEGGDGREKNWLPISNGDMIDFWYGDNPRTFLTYRDKGTSLEFYSYLKTYQRVKSNFGNIRGGCAPIDYDDNGIKIWFFHTLFQGKYRIGAYLTKALDIIKITPRPILTGDHIVFPCGAIQRDGNVYISMGIQDKTLGILKVLRDLEFVDV